MPLVALRRPWEGAHPAGRESKTGPCTAAPREVYYETAETQCSLVLRRVDDERGPDCRIPCRRQTDTCIRRQRSVRLLESRRSGCEEGAGRNARLPDGAEIP